MTTLPNRPNTALIVIDVQVGVVAGSPGRDAVVGNVAQLVERARAARTPVIWVQHHDDGPLAQGSDGWRIVPELAPDAAEPLIEKVWGDAFEETRLEQVLAGL